MGKTAGATGALSGLLQSSKEVKSENSKEVQKDGVKEAKSKRSYALKLSTIRKLDELKVYYFEPGTRLEKIVDEAICFYYEHKKESK
ncbi:MAG: hypothetical protein Q8920_16175 [Bacillota bacterium]|nr:hypothetical protein [Bacillota bacterium]